MSGGLQPRIRHVSSIQVRNFSPFPTRDTVASALTQPAERSQFTLHGHLSDDSDLTLNRRRSRKISLSSINSAHTIRSDIGDATVANGSPSETRGRKGKGVKVGSPAGPSSIPATLEQISPSRSGRTSGSAPTIRPRRPRTTSIMSTSSAGNVMGALYPPAVIPSSAASGSKSLSAMLPDNSQISLEKVINSRLVETFITVTIPPAIPTLGAEHTLAASNSRPSTPLASPSPKDKARVTPRQAKVPNGAGTRKDPKSILPNTRMLAHPVVKPNGKASTSSHKVSSLSIDSHSGCTSPAPSASTPNYFSDIHRPSTNPVFQTEQFAEWTNLSGTKLNIQMWAKSAKVSPRSTFVEGKGKGKQQDEPLTNSEWKSFQEWEINLNDLLPLPSEVKDNTELLPPNTLVFLLSPPGDYYYIPPPATPRERSSSPSAGYNSDPEFEVRQTQQNSAGSPPLSAHPSESTAPSRRRHRKQTDDAHDDFAKTAKWQDLFKLVSLQSCIVDTEASLNEIVSNLEASIDSDVLSKLKREVSEREAWVDDLRSSCGSLRRQSDELRYQLRARHKVLEDRRTILSAAKEQLKDDVISYSDAAMQVTEEEHRLQSLRSRFEPTRTFLISTLGSIFPIELSSPPDLLYTILDVPLPIPMGNNDPAPPLFLPNHKDINEDVVATSLGYAAQVVQLLATYLGKGLVYPITCIGSRSLVRDGISAMVGPRMFPLFSKGVDTYRFEYGVFLLNKNIEMLMVDRDLRPVDMRHTLPNLKNLLLTLTSGDETPLRFRNIHRPPSSVISISSLESPPPESPSTPDGDATVGGTTPKASTLLELPAENTTPPASGASTPTVPASLNGTEKKTRPSYLSLAPLSSFLRLHLPSTSVNKSTAKEIFDTGVSQDGDGLSAHPTTEVAGEQSDSTEDRQDVEADDTQDEEDRRTIRGAPVGLGIEVNGAESKEPEGLGRGIVATRASEKMEKVVPTTPSSTTQPAQSAYY
ncbi:hypothetical protein PLEOSDRAFT_1101335 [Pleurotus ostreatus PC15]|uniref:Autophagy-related protein 14 n=1 Tax=Pleurotus ostreatus (strain PC15) TaxID=1137138 RepID=A0A067NTN2_PLEO1|nr:hypothetical protein PLEOSDRAFT_1101335 [Pleurotus ostreatus PC15]